MEVLRHPLAQISGFADVNDRAEAVLVQVDAGTVRHRRKLVSDVVSDRHCLPAEKFRTGTQPSTGSRNSASQGRRKTLNEAGYFRSSPAKPPTVQSRL